MPEKFYRNRITWLTYLVLALYSYFLDIIGPITPFLKNELNLSYTISSLHYSAFAGGILLIGLVGHFIIEHLGRRKALWVGAFGLSLGACILTVGRCAALTIAAAFQMGMVGSLILAIIPAVISDQYGEMRAVALSEANMVCSLIAVAAPLLVGFFARFSNNWRIALGAAAICPIFLWLGFSKVTLPKSGRSEKVRAEKSSSHLPGLYWLFWLALVLSVATEFCMISWSASYLQIGLNMQPADAAQAVSLFLAGMVMGRLGVSRLVQRFSERNLVAGSILLACAGFLLFWKSNLIFLSLAGLLITGLGVAALYPLLISLAIEAAGEFSTEASSRATLASGAGILIIPLILGSLADIVGIHQAYGIVILLFIGNFLIIQLSRRYVLVQQPVNK